MRKASESYFRFENDHSHESTKVYVSKFIVHPYWDPKDTHYTADIAIAVLKEPIKLSNEVRHICLNTPSDPIQSLAGQSGQVYGWGFTEDLLKYGTELRHVEVPLVDQALCNSSHPTLQEIMSNTTFCAGASDGKTGPCNGN
jgi:hypothetical protein